MSFLFNEAFAATEPSGAGPYGSILILAVFIAIFYFLLWRPQSKRAKEHRELVDSLREGDEVVTSGGILGSVLTVTDEFIQLEVGDTVKLTLQKTAVAKTLPKGTISAMATNKGLSNHK